MKKDLVKINEDSKLILNRAKNLMSVTNKLLTRKENKHKTVFVTNDETKEIHEARTEQNNISIKNWDDVNKYVDISLHGYINRLKYSFPTPTTVGYIPEENKDLVLDLVWVTSTKKAALVTKRLPEHDNLKGWKIVAFGEAMRKI